MKQKKKKTVDHRRTTPNKAASTGHVLLPFIEHLHELRRRIYYVAASVFVWGAATYAIQQHVVNALLRPANGQHFIYTSPGGGIDFLFRVCIYTGLILSTPVIVYNLLGFIEPLMSRGSRRFIILSSLICAFLAILGVSFGYYVGLPAALHFLFHQFTTVQIKTLVTIQSYLSFVIAYMLGSALIFQMPIIIVSINRIKPLKPQNLFHYERWIILAAFVLAGLMNPTPNLFSQLLVAGPFILVYQFSILLVAIMNRHRRPKVAESLRAQDAATQAERLAKSRDLKPLDFPLPLAQPAIVSSSKIETKVAATAPVPVLKAAVRQRPPRPVVRTAVASNPLTGNSALNRLRDQGSFYAKQRQPRQFIDMRTSFQRPAS
jgi:sec-independent protein translocase protein TatC